MTVTGRGRARISSTWPLGTVLALLLGACGGGGGSTAPDPPGEDPGDDTHEAPARSYLVGWAPGAPRPDDALLLQTIDSMAAVSEITIIQQPVPWEPLLDGEAMEPLVDERVELADFLRTGNGLELVFLVDPLDGLDRRREPPALVEAGRSIREPAIREMHDAWVLALAERIRPAYFGLASEINTLAARGDPALHDAVRRMVNELAPRVRAASPGTRVFVSFQADQANGRLGDDGDFDHFGLIDAYDVDALGLSSYPGFAFDEPADVPDDYLAGFDGATDLPLLMVEGGWSSKPVPLADGSDAEQVAFFRRYEVLLDEIDARAWVMLTFTDLDVDALELPPERAEGLSNFARMGILDTELGRKPAYTEWERIFRRPAPP